MSTLARIIAATLSGLAIAILSVVALKMREHGSLAAEMPITVREQKTDSRSDFGGEALDADDAVASPFALVEDNIRLATSHYEILDDGQIHLPNDKPMSFDKKYRFADGEVITLHYEVLVRPESRLDPDDEEFSTVKMYYVFDLIESVDEQAMVWAHSTIAFCDDLAASNQPRRFDNECEGFEEDMPEKIAALVAEQARNGNVWAMETYAESLSKAGRRDAAQSVYLDLWKRGYVPGLTGLILPSDAYGDLDFDQQVRAASYLYASYVLSAAYLDGLPDTGAADRQRALRRKMREYLDGANLTAFERIEAEAKALLKANEHCCKLYTGIY